MGATISSFEVQSFHPDNSFKINTGLLPAQHIAPANAKPKRTPSSLVKGKPLIFAAMALPYNAYPTPPPAAEVVKMPPRLFNEETDGTFDMGFSKTVLDSWDQQQSTERQTPKVNGNAPLPNAAKGPTPRMNGNAPLPPQSPPLRLYLSRSLRPTTRRVEEGSKSVPRSLVAHDAFFAHAGRPTYPSHAAHAHQVPADHAATEDELRRAAAAEPVHRRARRGRASRFPRVDALLDDDPFAKVDPVRMLKPTSRDGPPSAPPPPPSSTGSSSPRTESSAVPESESEEPATPRQDTFFEQQQNAVNTTPPQKVHNNNNINPQAPPSPVTPEEYRTARSRRRGDHLEKTPPSAVKGVEVRETRIPGPFPLAVCVTSPPLLSALLAYLSFYDWCILSAVTKEIRMRLVGTAELREVALERYLRTVGYSRWAWEDVDPLELSLLDLHDYMRGVGLPTHEYSRVAEGYVQSFSLPPAARDPAHLAGARNLTMSTRAYTRVVLRLRAQAEREASDTAAAKAASPPSAAKKRLTSNGYASSRSSPSRTSSRAPSPTSGHSQPHSTAPGTAFRSPLFRVKRAPLLRVFVPSPDGDWLSDKSVLECEAELKRAGVLALLRIGDVVWDIAVGDEGNVGRLVWDGSYLIDLDYKYSSVGDLPQYLPTLAFPPSYFHRVIRTGPASTNPVVHVDLSPWGQEIAANLQLLQDRVRTETPQGNIHNVVRWCTARPSPSAPRQAAHVHVLRRAPPAVPALPIPETAGLFVDPGWYGTVVVETEGTNEALADLQDRRAAQEHKDAKKVFKILREKSRPGEIWIRAVGPKERLF
ncbi:hypothetical protein B0H13DRAFT_2558192 [Mycena leptocephala]|nr:hypothetical protein B0H13DRAFT_2558192 [Mycena leptocephala]